VQAVSLRVRKQKTTRSLRKREAGLEDCSKKKRQEQSRGRGEIGGQSMSQEGSESYIFRSTRQSKSCNPWESKLGRRSEKQEESCCRNRREELLFEIQGEKT
jgi:hypothetical protein